MVLDRLCEAERYESMHPRFREAFEFLRNASEKDCGRYELGDGMYVNISEVSTHEEGEVCFEAHRSYIDIQYLFDGHSACVWAHTDDLTTVQAYDPEKDFELLTGRGSPVPVNGGEFYILWPQDAHEPHRQDGAKATYKLAVVKVPV